MWCCCKLALPAPRRDSWLCSAGRWMPPSRRWIPSCWPRSNWGKEVSVLGSLLETGYRATGADIITSRRFLKEKPDVARRFMMAIVEGVQMARTQKDRTLRMLSKQLKEHDPRILEAQY